MARYFSQICLAEAALAPRPTLRRLGSPKYLPELSAGKTVEMTLTGSALSEMFNRPIRRVAQAIADGPPCPLTRRDER